ncbi:MAG TPA: AMP-binding protein [Frankiaceae bacterium]|nr:AMP-binding protein [Frankiaceae bacterium]
MTSSGVIDVTTTRPTTPPRPSYEHGTSTTPLIGDPIGALLERTAAEFGDHEAVVSRAQDRRLTWAELAAEVDLLARGLLDLGLTRGDRVGIWSPNNVEWLLLQYATAKLGILLVNINPAYRSHEIRFVLQQAGCRALVAAPTFKTSDYRAMVGEIRADCPALEHIRFLGDPDWDALFNPRTPSDAVAAVSAGLSADDPINIQYTSGTTGFPKGATLSHHNLLNNGFFVGEICGYDENDRIAVPVPFYHCFGMVMANLAALTHGCCVVIPAPAFEPAATLAAIAEERCTSLYGVPTMFVAELEDAGFADYDLSSLRTGIMAGSPCPVEVMKRVISEMGMAEVTICYGMTETSPVSTQTRRDDDLDRRVSTVGRPHPHTEVKVVDPESGRTLPRGETGEFCTRGYSVMLGYWDEPEKTAAAIDAARWMHTGDLATMDEAGYLNIVGRTKDMVIRGGENIYPREIEEFLYGHPSIADVQVIGVPDARFGEELCAWVRRREGASLTEDEVRDYCHGQLAHYKVPKYVRFVDEFPMTITGKIQKYKMRETSIDQLGLEDAAAARHA